MQLRYIYFFGFLWGKEYFGLIEMFRPNNLNPGQKNTPSYPL